VLAFPSLLASGNVQAEGREIKIGFIGPVTVQLGSFGEGDAFVLSHIRKALENGIITGVHSGCTQKHELRFHHRIPCPDWRSGEQRRANSIGWRAVAIRSRIQVVVARP
jgi:hypothetical protein